MRDLQDPGANRAPRGIEPAQAVRDTAEAGGDDFDGNGALETGVAGRPRSISVMLAATQAGMARCTAVVTASRVSSTVTRANRIAVNS